VEEVVITFNAKVSSTTQTSTVDTSQYASTYATRWWWWWNTASFSSSYSSQNTRRNSNTEERTFEIEVTVKAVQDDVPAGMAKVLDILEEAIVAARSAP
jgi:hypothetical protein